MIKWFDGDPVKKAHAGINVNSLFISSKIYKDMKEPKYAKVGIENNCLIIKPDETGFRINNQGRYIRISSRGLIRFLKQEIKVGSDNYTFYKSYKSHEENGIWRFEFGGTNGNNY